MFPGCSAIWNGTGTDPCVFQLGVMHRERIFCENEMAGNWLQTQKHTLQGEQTKNTTNTEIHSVCSDYAKTRIRAFITVHVYAK